MGKNNFVMFLGGEFMQTTVFNVSGLNNTNSAVTLRDAITSLEGVSNVSVDVNSSKVLITFDPTATDLSTIRSTITSTGFYIQ